MAKTSGEIHRRSPNSARLSSCWNRHWAVTWSILKLSWLGPDNCRRRRAHIPLIRQPSTRRNEWDDQDCGRHQHHWLLVSEQRALRLPGAHADEGCGAGGPFAMAERHVLYFGDTAE